MKIVYIDIETTGTDPEKNGIHQIAGFVEIDWKLVDTFNFRVQPRKGAMVSPEALKVGNVTIEQLRTYPEMGKVYYDFMALLGKHIAKFNKKDKAFFCGYNAQFDNQFMRRWFEDNNDKYFGSWFWSGTLDVMGFALNKLKKERQDMVNFQLATVAEKMGVKAEGMAHDAMYDITITRKMYHQLEGIAENVQPEAPVQKT